VLNNQGYSYMLRGNYARARELLLAAQAKDPSNPYIRNNLDLLEASVRARSAVR
jgi:Flp pilus assembly protein TadD